MAKAPGLQGKSAGVGGENCTSWWMKTARYAARVSRSGTQGMVAVYLICSMDSMETSPRLQGTEAMIKGRSIEVLPRRVMGQLQSFIQGQMQLVPVWMSGGSVTDMFTRYDVRVWKPGEGSLGIIGRALWRTHFIGTRPS